MPHTFLFAGTKPKIP